MEIITGKLKYAIMMEKGGYLQNSTRINSLLASADWKLPLFKTNTFSSVLISSSANATANTRAKRYILKFNMIKNLAPQPVR